jgi:predicted transcriptional regulator
MNSAIERLLTLRISDVMSRNVIRVEAAKTMLEAAGTLMQHFISGAPVTAPEGQCIGILSATDFVRCCAEAGSGESGGRAKNSACPVPLNDRVASHMSRLVQSIAVDRPLTEAARLMCQNHIHRLVVLDSEGRPVGMITALDIVSALINALEE